MEYDVIIVGSGAGGCAAACRLAEAGKRVLLLERGPILPRDGSTLDVDLVVRRKAFLETEPWLDRHGRTILPQERSNLGGKTKWYGAALLRFAPSEFEADAARCFLPWPIDYSEMQPWYEEAERLLDVRTFPVEPDFARIAAGLRRNDPGWTSAPLPMGLAADILDHPEEATHFDAFASPKGLKADGETRLLSRVRHLPNLEIQTGARVSALLPSRHDPRAVAGVECADGTRHHAHAVLLAAGALHSPRLLQHYLEETTLAARLPGYDLVGRFYKFHLLTAMLMVNARPQTDRLRKTAVLTHADLPHSSVQPLGWLDGELLAPEFPGFLPRRLVDAIGRRVYGFFLQTEDGSHPDNRVRARAPGSELPLLDYHRARIPASVDEHRRLVTRLQGQLLRIGYVGLVRSIPVSGSAHACGSLVAGNDPRTSVVGADGRVHGMENLFVVDGSVLPRSSRVNPALTIYAWSLRVASGLHSSGGIDEHSSSERRPVRA